MTLALFRQLFFAAVLAGLAAGVVATAGQSLKLWPLILAAEVYENAGGEVTAHEHGDPAAGHGHEASDAAGHSHEHDEDAWAPEDGLERTVYTLGANLLVGIGFGLLLMAAFVLRGGADWRNGLLWGCAGFATFALAPSLGLPPELPGSQAAALGLRQAWWLCTAAGTAVGLALIVFSPRALWKLVGIAAILIPHIIGAPQPESHGGALPAELAAAFVTASLGVNLLFWLALGAVSAMAFNYLVKPVMQPV